MQLPASTQASTAPARPWPPSIFSGSSGLHRYVLHGGGPPTAPDEVEDRARLAIEIVVLWQGELLSATHVAAPGRCLIGGSGSCCEVSLPLETLGAEQLCVAEASHTKVFAVLPAGVRGCLSLPDGSRHGFELAPERLLPLGPGYRAHLCFDELEIQVAAVPAARTPRLRLSVGFDAATLAYFACSALSVTGLLAAMALMAPPLGLTTDEALPNEHLYLLQQYLTASAERTQQPERDSRALQRAAAARPPPPPPSEPAPRAERTLDEPPGNEPTLGAEPIHPALHPRERHGELERARGFGMIALLQSNEAQLADPRLVFHRELTGGEEALMQQLFNSDNPMRDEGPGGLALSGTGLRGGQPADEPRDAPSKCAWRARTSPQPNASASPACFRVSAFRRRGRRRPASCIRSRSAPDGVAFGTGGRGLIRDPVRYNL